MSKSRSLVAAFLVLALTVFPAVAYQQQQPYGALERGWRTGYSDGYQAGWRDALERRASDYQSKEEYASANRAYIAAYGSLEDYRDGYQQGFESGYGEGYNRRGFNSELPPDGVRRRGARDTPQTSSTRRTDVDDEDARDDATRDTRGGTSSSSHSIPSNTVLRIELLNRLSTDVSQRGDRFEARVIEPQEYEGAIVSGRVANVERAGKVRSRAQLQLDFEQIRMADGDWMDFRAQVVEVLNGAGRDDVGEVDEEGGVRGRSTTKDDVAKVGAAAGIGAIIGAIAGGGKGAGIGAIIGAGVGTGGVMTQRGKDIRFEQGQQFRIRTSGRMSND